MADTYTYQTFKGNFYVITTGTSSTTITDTKSNTVLTTIPAKSQGIIFAIGKEIKASKEIKINIVR